jgi:hypothetical protein
MTAPNLAILAQAAQSASQSLKDFGVSVGRSAKKVNHFALHWATGKNANWFPRRLQDRSRYHPHTANQGQENQRRRRNYLRGMVL